MDGHEESNLEKTLKPEKRRFFDEDLEDETDSNFENSAVNGELKDDLDIQSSFLFGGKESREVSESSAQDVEEIRSVIPDLSNSQANALLEKASPVSDRNERISTAVGMYFENTSLKNQAPKKKITPALASGNGVKLLNSVDSRPTTPNKKIRDYGARLPKRRKPTVHWRRFIGSMQVSALATRPTVKPLKYGSELKIVKTGNEATGKMYYANGRKKASMANFVRLLDVSLNREVGRVPEDVAMFLFPLADSDELEFEATMIYCNNQRLSVGDTFVVQLDCFLTSVVFENSDANERRSLNNERRFFSQNVVESEEELRLKSRRLALLSLFDQIQMRPITDSDTMLTENENGDQVIDLDEESDNESRSSPERPTFSATQMQEDVLNVNQLKSLYKSTLSMESSKHLPETNPSSDIFKLELRKYQKQGLTWMLRREREFDHLSIESPSEEVDGNMMNPLWKQFRWPKDLSWYSQKKSTCDLSSQNDMQFFYANLHTGEFSQVKPVIKSMLKGGILADEMGLGKTISILAMILTVPSDSSYGKEKLREASESPDPEISVLGSQWSGGSKPYASGTTLVVVPMSLLSQWQQEFEKASSSKEATCEIYYGGNTSSLKS